jgi:MFS family permease
LMAAAALMLLAGGLHFTLTPAYGRSAGMDAHALGLIGSSFYAGFFASSLLNPLLFRALGHRRLFFASAGLVAAALLGQSLIVGILPWMALRFAVGFLVAGMFAALESWLNATASNANRGQTLSVYTVSNQAALVLSQFLFAALPDASLLGFQVAAAVFAMAALPMAAMRGAPPAPPASRRLQFGALYRASPVAFVAFAANGLMIAPFWVLGPAFAADKGLDHAMVGVFMSLPLLGSLVSQWPVARLSDRMDRRKVLWPVAILAGLAALGVAYAPVMGGEPAMFVFAVLFGATAFCVGTLAVAHLNDRLTPAQLTEAAGASAFVYAATSVIGPTIAATLMDVAGPEGLFLHAAMVLGALGLFVGYRMRKRR